MKRSYTGPALDGEYQHISEAPHWQNDGETVYGTPKEDPGRIKSENVPGSSDSPPTPDTSALEGQTTLDDWSSDLHA